MVGLLHEDEENRLRLTELGRTLERFLPHLTEACGPVLGGYVAQALASAQLRNPIGAGKHYDNDIRVNPFQVIWRVMLASDNRVSSDELNRAVFRIRCHSEISEVVDRIHTYRENGDANTLGAEVVPPGTAQNDRIIPWMAPASFGWLLFKDKRDNADGYYTIPENMQSVLSYASQLSFPYLATESTVRYTQYLSACAGVPKDLR